MGDLKTNIDFHSYYVGSFLYPTISTVKFTSYLDLSVLTTHTVRIFYKSNLVVVFMVQKEFFTNQI